MELFSVGIMLVIVWFSFLFTCAISENYCKDGNNHRYEFKKRLNGRTGDLGFGIKSPWETDDFKCKKCAQEKTEWNH